MDFAEVMKYTPNQDYLNIVIRDNRTDRVNVVKKYIDHWARNLGAKMHYLKITEFREDLNIIWQDKDSFSILAQDAERIWDACCGGWVHHHLQQEGRVIRSACGGKEEKNFC